MLSIPSIDRTSLSVVVEPSGLTVGVFPDEVDLSNASAIRDQLIFLVDSGSTPLALDLTGTRFCDCAGVGAIIRVDLRATTQETPLCLVLPSEGIVARIAALTGLTRRLPVTYSLDGARTLLRAPVLDDRAP